MILDTNALSAFADDSAGAIAAISAASQVAIPVVVLGEYRYGIAHSARARQYGIWLTAFLETCRVLEITIETASEYALIRSELRRLGHPIPANDVWIAALCRQHYLPLLSRDRHFDAVKGLRRQGW